MNKMLIILLTACSVCAAMAATNDVAKTNDVKKVHRVDAAVRHSQVRRTLGVDKRQHKQCQFSLSKNQMNDARKLVGDLFDIPNAPTNMLINAVSVGRQPDGSYLVVIGWVADDKEQK